MAKKTIVKNLIEKGTVSLFSVGLIGLACSPALSEGLQGRQLAPKTVGQTPVTTSVRTVSLNQSTLAALTNNLFGSPAERQKFLANPAKYAENFLGGKLDANSLAQVGNLKNQVATGFCCAGCGCGAPVKPVDMSRF